MEIQRGVMKSIKPFIDAGFNTVPLKGELKRLESGKKTTPIFEADWKHKALVNRNEKVTTIGGMLTGEINGIIAVDCDDGPTWTLFNTLDIDYTFKFVSKGKEGGTIIYKQPIDLKTSFSIRNEELNLDFFSEQGFVYLPTESNESKVAWDINNVDDLPELKEPPASTLALIKNLYIQYTLGKGTIQKEVNQTNTSTSYLAPLVKILVQEGRVIPRIFRILTPKDFRDTTEYIANGYLNPKEVADGRGSEYLSKVSAILGSDPSIDEELYVKAMELINTLWDNPMESDKFDNTIVFPMIEGKAQINGERIWKYDAHWETRGLRVHTKRSEVVDVFYDEKKQNYFLSNQLTGKHMKFNKEAELFQHLEVVSAVALKRAEVKSVMPLVNTTIRPELPPGFFEEDDIGKETAYNLFQQSVPLGIINNPDSYKPLYKEPTTILNYLNTLIPDKVQRRYVLRFLKTKFTTFAYSPVVLYFLGISGSGKDTFVSLLEQILGEENEYIAKPSANEFIEKHNGWLIDKYFAQLDEYGDQLQIFSQKQEALGKIKSYTGKKVIQIRQMRADGYALKHAITFILTANTNPLVIDENDRRILLIETPNILREADWIQAEGGMTLVIDKLQTEIKDFAYYLATEVEALAMDEYNNPPLSGSKVRLIAQMLQPADKLIFSLKHQLVESILDMIEEADFNPFDSIKDVSENGLHELLINAYPDQQISKKSLSIAIKKYGINKLPTTRSGVKDYRCIFSTVSSALIKREFEDQETDSGNAINSMPEI